MEYPKNKHRHIWFLISYVSEVKIKYPFAEIILLTAFGNIADGVQAMKNGAFDYITKGDDNDKIIPMLNKTIEKIQLRKRIEQLEKQLVSDRKSHQADLEEKKAKVRGAKGWSQSPTSALRCSIISFGKALAYASAHLTR